MKVDGCLLTGKASKGSRVKVKMNAAATRRNDAGGRHDAPSDSSQHRPRPRGIGPRWIAKFANLPQILLLVAPSQRFGSTRTTQSSYPFDIVAIRGEEATACSHTFPTQNSSIHATRDHWLDAKAGRQLPSDVFP
jgi:hypothetical protein